MNIEDVAPKKYTQIISIVGVLLSFFVWAYTTFATIKYVDDKHQSVVVLLENMQDSLDSIEERVYDLNGNKEDKN